MLNISTPIIRKLFSFDFVEKFECAKNSAVSLTPQNKKNYVILQRFILQFKDSWSIKPSAFFMLRNGIVSSDSPVSSIPLSQTLQCYRSAETDSTVSLTPPIVQ